jgi:pimeloyl-ACP methyl ester carboxylesterase
MTPERTTLCLLPGLDGTGHLYEPLVRELGEQFFIQVLAYDSRHFDGYAALAQSLSVQLPSDRPFVVVAESFAGPLGVLLAHRRPRMLKALVLAATFVHAPLPASMVLAALVERMPLMRPPRWLLRKVLMERDAPSSVERDLEGALESLPLQTLRQRAMAALRVDVRAELSELDLPLLYLQANRDRLIGPHAGGEIGRLAPHAVMRRIAAPHFLFQHAPRDAADSIRQFLQACANR